LSVKVRIPLLLVCESEDTFVTCLWKWGYLCYLYV